MFLRHLTLKNFRNYTALDIDFDQNAYLFIGDNGNGKTNLMEAIYLLSFGKSFRKSPDHAIINHNADNYQVAGIFNDEYSQKKILIQADKKQKKQVFLNNKKISALSHMIGQINTILFSQKDMELIQGQPVLRRNFFNMLLSFLYKEYLLLLQRYQKTLKQRNAILKNRNTDLLNTWDHEIAQLGLQLSLKRLDFMKHFQKKFLSIMKKLGLEQDTFCISYQSSYQKTGLDLESIKKLYYTHREKELSIASTIFGPHRDEFLLYLNKYKLRDFGSLGQMKLAALGLKLSQLACLKANNCDSFIFLLDDVLLELDNKRKSCFFSYLPDDAQYFITTTDNKYSNFLNKSIIRYHVIDGTVRNGK